MQKSLAEIYDFLDSISPFETQESWDNSGIIIGNSCAQITKIYASLEATLEIAQTMEPDSLLITHHPLIFSPLKTLRYDEYPSNIVSILVRKNISLISMHTNFDKSHLNEYFTQEILGFSQYIKENIACIATHKTSLDELIRTLKNRLKNTTLKITRAKEQINTIAIICGAGISEIEKIESRIDCVISGDIKYHDAMKYKSLGISLIDVGHYDSEAHFGEILASHLKKIDFKAIILDSQNPFSYP